MNCYIGFDTSNYTTSAAAYSPETDSVVSLKKPLEVKEGEIGLRQSEAVFQHVAALPELAERLFKSLNGKVAAVCASVKPRDESGSYMPCFLAGEGTARSVASALGVPFYACSHQAGHILAALYSAGKLELVDREFIAFHVSGGTTEALLVSPDSEKIIKTKIIAKTLDLNAGQAVDRVGRALGLPFPAGAELDALARRGKPANPVRIALKGNDCCLSGLENLCLDMLSGGALKEDTARFCIDYIAGALRQMAKKLLGEYGEWPLVFSGGVMSNSIIRESFTAEFGAHFAGPEYSSDNAAGVAIFGYLYNER